MKNKKITNEELMKEIQELKKQLAEKQTVTIINVPQVQEVKPAWTYYPKWYLQSSYITGSNSNILC